MNTGVIPMRYARALLAFAKDRGTQEALYSQMKGVAMSFSQFGNLRDILNNPIIGKQQKLNLLESAAGEHPCKEYLKFIDLLLAHKRENYLQSIALMYIDLYRKEQGIVVGSLTTAVPVTPKEQERIKQMLMPDNKGKLEFNTNVDADILGGFVFCYDTYRLDASVSAQLKRLKAQLLEKNRKTV